MKKKVLILLGTTLASLTLCGPAAAASDPLFVTTPELPPTGALNGPCGLAVDSTGELYVSDFYHHDVDLFSGPSYTNVQLSTEDHVNGPCGLALDATNHIYVNDFHKDVVKYGPAPAFSTGSVFPLPAEDTVHHLATGVAVGPEGHVYVDNRTYVSVYDASGAPVEEGGEPVRIGLGSLEDGYGVAVSSYPATLGYLYVPDAATNTVKVYDPLTSTVNPKAQIKDPFAKPFVSLRDSAVAVARENGDVYFADNLQPEVAERPQAEIYVYGANDLFKGHLKYNVTDALPPGIAVDNSTGLTQGRVYVTSGNGTPASIYAYAPGSATAGTPLPPIGFSTSPPSGSTTPGAEATGSAAPSSNPPATSSNIIQSENVRLNVESRLSPKHLPRKGVAPIAVTVGWQISTADGSPPPRLKTLQIAINKEGRLDTEGLPTCPYNKIQPASTQRALSNCRSSLVGRGTFSAEIALKGQEEAESYEAKGQLLLFNGKEGKKQVLFGQIYSAHPFATSFVIPFHLTEKKKGTYGTVLSATLPASLRSWGNLNAIEMRLSRKYGANGKRHSFLSAGCPAPKGLGLASFKLAHTAFGFSGGKKLASTVEGECRVRG